MTYDAVVMQRVGLFVLGALCGSLVTLIAVVGAGGLYESRLPPFDFPQLARDHCEPVNGPASILYFRCPRFAIR